MIGEREREREMWNDLSRLISVIVAERDGIIRKLHDRCTTWRDFRRISRPWDTQNSARIFIPLLKILLQRDVSR